MKSNLIMKETDIETGTIMLQELKILQYKAS